MYRDMTRGGITRSLLLFALPMMAGSLLQQLYNVADTLIVGRALGRDASEKQCVDFDAAEPVVGAITPVPGGVGSVTTAVLALHVAQAAENNT